MKKQDSAPPARPSQGRTASGQPKGVYDRVKGFVKETVSSVEEGQRFEVGGTSASKSRFKEGDRVILQTVKEEVVAGTVRWVGPVRVRKDMTVDTLPVVGIETVSDGSNESMNVFIFFIGQEN